MGRNKEREKEEKEKEEEKEEEARKDLERDLLSASRDGQLDAVCALLRLGADVYANDKVSVALSK
jgi:hypothetical protein